LRGSYPPPPAYQRSIEDWRYIMTENRSKTMPDAPAPPTVPKTVSGTGEELAVRKVLLRFSALVANSELFIPAGYSPENAMKEAYLVLSSPTALTRDKRPILQACTQTSIIRSLTDMLIQGLSPAKRQCYFVPYGRELTLIRSYMGTVAAAKRVGGIKEARANCVYEEDVFEYEIVPETGLKKIARHVQSLGNIDNKKIIGAYAVLTFDDRPTYIEVMTIDEIRLAWAQGDGYGKSKVHANFTQEMSKKTVLNRSCKMFINTSDDSDLLVGAFNRTTANEGAELLQISARDVDAIDADTQARSDAIFGIERDPAPAPTSGQEGPEQPVGGQEATAVEDATAGPGPDVVADEEGVIAEEPPEAASDEEVPEADETAPTDTQDWPVSADEVFEDVTPAETTKGA
jgi:recombination protein RecT